MIANKPGAELAQTNLIYDSTIYKGKNSMIYKCHLKENTKMAVCVKSRKRDESDETVEKEVKLLQKITDITPSFYYFNRTQEHDLIVMELKGPNLHDLFEGFNKKFSLKTIVLIGLNLLTLLEELHAEGYVHGHLSPKKIITEINPYKNHLFITGLSEIKKYRNEKSEHIRYKEKPIAGLVTNEFASVNTYAGIRLSRRDDIESLAYILLHFDTKGEIFDAKNRHADHKDLGKWKTTTPAELMHPKASIEFVQLLNYAKGLKFDEQPNYERIQKILRNTLQKEGIKQQDEIKYDWSSKADHMAQKNQASEKRKALHGFLVNESNSMLPNSLQ